MDIVFKPPYSRIVKLTPEEIQRILVKLIAEWKQRDLLKVTVDETRLREALAATITRELKLEDDLNAEVEKMLAKFDRQFASGQLDRRKMHGMVKAQLAKERKIVL